MRAITSKRSIPAISILCLCILIAALAVSAIVVVHSGPSSTGSSATEKKKEPDKPPVVTSTPTGTGGPVENGPGSGAVATTVTEPKSGGATPPDPGKPE